MFDRKKFSATKKKGFLFLLILQKKDSYIKSIAIKRKQEAPQMHGMLHFLTLAEKIIDKHTEI